VTVGSSYKRVSDFVKHGVAYCILTALHRENPAQRDKPVTVAAATKPTLGVVPLEFPSGQTVSGHQHLGFALCPKQVHQ
jgi:hypothetical protein